MAYIDRPLDNSIGTSMTLREGCDLINDNFEVLAADKLKLNGIEPGAQVNTVTSVAGQTGDVVLTKSDVGLNNVDNTADIDKSVAFAQNAASSDTLEGSSLSDVQTFVTDRTGDTSTLTTTATELTSAVNELDVEKFDKTGGTISGNVTVSGDLTVNGTSFTVNTQEVLVEDNTITVNNGEVGAGVTAGTAGIIVDRGLSPDYEFVFDEASDTFRVGEVGNTQAVAAREDTPVNGGVSVWNDLESRFDTTLNPQVDSIKFSTSGVGEGTLSWNTDEQTVDLTLGSSVLQVGQEFLVNVRNDTASLIPNGTPLMFTGTLGASGRILVVPMDGTNRENYKRIVGFATENIPAGTDGKATALGKIRGIDTTGVPYGETWSEGDVIYISPTVVGGLTKVEPSSTGLDMAVAIVVNVHASVGTLYLRVLPIDRNRISPAVQDALDGKLDLTGGVIPPSQLPSATETEKGVVEKATTQEALAGAADKFPDAAGVNTVFNSRNRAELVKSTEAASNGRVTVRFTTKGQPCFFVKIPAFNCEDIAPGGELGTGLHPAFLFNGNPKPYILVGQYLSSVIDGEYVSQPNRIPDSSRTYDQELALAAATGSGFKVLSNWDWAAVSLWCMANGFQPEGNTDWGRHHVSKWDTAIRYDGNAPGAATGNGRTYTGSGPVKWSHSNNVSGIFDMVGNVWERVSGLKLIDNIFHIAPDNGVYTEAQYTNTGVAAPTSGAFSTRGTTTSIPLRQALVFPVNSALAPVGYFYVTSTDERIPLRGGGWDHSSGAGLGALHLSAARSDVFSNVGSRLAFSD